jgi:hypothetical protein
MRREDDTEPMTKILGTIEPMPRQRDPQRRLTDGEHTRLEIARPRVATAEPVTQVVDPSTLRRPR